MHFKSVNKEVVANTVHTVIAINLQNVRSLILDRSQWAYSFTFYCATDHGDSFGHLIVRLFLHSIKNLQLLAIPFKEAQSCEALFTFVKELLSGLLGDSWRTKLLSCTTNGAKNMTGQHNGAFKRFQSVALPGFFRVWCTARQLDLFIRSFMTGVLNQEFGDPFLSIIGNLRRQFAVPNKMDKTCPSVSGTRLLSIGSCTRWLTCCRVHLMQYSICN